MNPNFFMIFAPTDLDAFSATYLSSFYLSEQQKSVLPSVLKAYPHVTVIEVDVILDQLRKIIQQVSLAIEYILYFAVVAGILVLLASINASMDERLYHCALLRSFGASASMLRKAQASEFFTLGAVSGLLAVILTEVINFCVYKWVFELEYTPSYGSWLFVPLLAGLVVVIAGLFGARKVIKQNPMQVIRQLSL
jgi:putative ABC transport system permease protein